MTSSIHRTAFRTFTWLVAGALALLLPCAARAQEPASRPATRPTSAPSKPEADQQARKLIDEALAKYRAAKTYQDKLEARTDLAAADKAGKDVGQTDEYAASLLYAAPNRLALVADNYAVQSDGKTLWLYTGTLDQYTEGPAPEHLDYTKIGEDVMIDDPPHPVLIVLTQPDKKFAELFPMVREFTAVAREERDGRPGTRLSGLFDPSETPFSNLGPEPIPFGLWFDEKTGLLGELKLDLTVAARKAMGLTDEKKDADEDAEEDIPGRPAKIERATATLRFNDVKLDAEIPTEGFVFKPEKGTEKVKEFDWEAAMKMPDPEELIGKPAPAFSGPGLDDKPLSLEGLRGRVVVLDFWATWCGPCVQSMPQIQKLSEHFADKSVTVIGVNQDPKGAEKKVRTFIEDKKITFRQYPDPGGKLGRAYKAGAIPCTFLIDGKGVIQAVHVGAAPTLQEDLTKKIDKLLKGENLIEPDKLGKDKKEPAEEPAKEKE